MPFGKGRVVAVCLIACWPLLAWSTEEAEPEELAEDKSWWLNSHEAVSKTVGSWSTNIDSFLSGTQSKESSDSYLEVRFGSVLGESDRSGFFEFHTRLQLPNTQERLRLVVESEPDTLAPESLRNSSSRQGDSVVDSALRSNISAAVRYIKEDIGLDIDSGVKVDFPLDPFLRLRLKQGAVKERFEWWQKQEAFAYYSRGIGARYGIGLGYALSPSSNWSTDLGVTWLDKESMFYVRENLVFQHRINEKNRLAYQLSFLQSGEHSIEPDTVLYNIQYERLLYQDWLIGQVTPQMTHESEEDYEGKFSLTLSMVILLGPEYLH